MTSSACSIVFHIGAHKTATTHLQRSLSKASDLLSENGIRYYGPQDFRLPGRAIPALFGMKEQKTGSARRAPLEQLELMRKDAHRLIFSEENYIGVLNGPRRFPVERRYPNAAPRISQLAAALGRPIDVSIGIRRPTPFLNSAYCQQLMGGRVVPFDHYKRINPVSSVDWLDLITRLRAAEGVDRLVVWCYEDYAALFPQICAAVVGAEHADLVRPLDRRIHEGLSEQAVAETLQRHKSEVTEKLGFAMRKMMPVGPAHPAFDGFDAADHARADAAYAEQVAGIATMPGVTVLQPDRS